MTKGKVYDRRIYWEALWKKRNYPFALNMVPLIVAYDREGKIGPRVLDLGCSCSPVTNWLDLSRCRRILLDVSRHVHDLSALADRPVTVACDLCAFEDGSEDLKIFEQGMEKTGSAGLDTVICADNLINYIPWQPVFGLLHRYLKRDGLAILCFGINIGRGEAFHHQRPASSAEVRDFFVRTLGYEVLEFGSQKGCHGFVFRKLR